MRSREIDLTQTSINIDSLFDVYVQTQKEAGKDPELEERNLVIDDSGNLVQCSKSDVKPQSSTDEKEASKCEDARNIRSLGSFYDIMSDELDEEDDGPYVCEYCTDIGYRKEYKPHICDSCDVCGTCAEFSNNECSGCEYSVYRTGNTYGDELRSCGIEVSLEQDEQDIMHAIQFQEYNENLAIPDTGFTVSNYDHRVR